MANQDLKIWALQDVKDPVKGNHQKRTLRQEEWLQGLGRLSGVSSQIFNTLINLLTHYSAPSDICPYPYPSQKPLTSEVLLMNGQAISPEQNPVLYETYGGNLPDMTGDNLTGFVWVVRNH